MSVQYTTGSNSSTIAVAGGHPDPQQLRVPCITLRGLLEKWDVVDLIHLDVQGEELRVLRHAQDRLNEKVRRVIMATHSRRIHRTLRKQFQESGWDCGYDFGLRTRARTAFGDVLFLDGLLAFVNRRAGL